MPHPQPDTDDANAFLNYDWVKEVANTPENDLRSARIALTYSKFAIALDNYMFETRSVERSRIRSYQVDECDANWFHFATWAVLTAGRNIGNTRAPQRLNLLPNAWRNQLAPAVIHARAEDHQRIGRTLAWAQRSIFVTVSFALLATLESDSFKVGSPRLGETSAAAAARIAKGGYVAPDNEATKDAFLKLAWGTGADCDATEDNWRYYELSCENFKHYVTIKKTLDADPKFDAAVLSRLMLLANVWITAVEQKLIDEGVRAIVDTVPDRAFSVLEGRLGQVGERLFRVPRQLVLFAAPERLKPARDVVNAAWGRLLTDQLFVMALPGETLRVGRDIPPLDPRKPYYPTALRDLRKDNPFPPVDPTIDAAMEELRKVMFRFDRTTADGRGSGAQDWRVFESRMNWAITLLRSRQADSSLFWPPFSRSDAKRIIDGELPERGGDPMELEVLPPLDRRSAN